MATKSKENPEQHRICNVVESRKTERDWNIGNAIAASAIAAPAAALPASVDLRAAWWDIGDQESTGSCVGWASTDGVARYHMVKAGKLPQDGRLSPRCTWMASKETDEITNRPETFIEGAGTSLKAAMEFLRKYGSVPESLLPFHVATAMYLARLIKPLGNPSHRIVFQPRQKLRRLAQMACDPRPLHGRIERGRDLG